MCDKSQGHKNMVQNHRSFLSRGVEKKKSQKIQKNVQKDILEIIVGQVGIFYRVIIKVSLT